MRRKIWLALALAAVLAVCFAAAAVAARHTSDADPRPTTVTKGLDFFHGRQQADGGFGSMADTEWVIIGAVASGERMGSSMWTVGGTNPFEYLQAHSHTEAATSAEVTNTPVYYAQAVLSYVAADQADQVYTAGTPHVDLLAELYQYQDMLDGSPTKGAFSPARSTFKVQAVRTTAWAILAMAAMGETGAVRFTAAERWLATQQDTDGGFPDQAGDPSDCLDTALAIQALTVAAQGTMDSAVLPAARAYLKAGQGEDGGFPAEAGGATDAWATSAAIQAILALGETPDGADWTVGGNTPASALATLQQKDGSYQEQAGESGSPITTTGWALTALREMPFTTYPATRPPALKAFHFRPRTLRVSPRAGVKYVVHTMFIYATYTDGPKGTGVDPKACRVYLDGANRTKRAHIGTHALHVRLTDLPNGTHTYKLEIVDYAGNVKTVQRSFVVAVPTPTPQPTYSPGPTIYPTPTPYPTPEPTTPTPYPTLTPYPTPSTSASTEPTGTPVPSQSGTPISGTAILSPSPSQSPGPGSGAGGGSAAGFLGGTLLAMLPVGAAISYLVLRRREHALGAASEGETLPGGGSAWERLKAALSKSKDLAKPAGR